MRNTDLPLLLAEDQNNALQSYLDSYCQTSEEENDYSLLEEAESAAPKFSLYHLDRDRHLCIIDLNYVKRWNYCFDHKQVEKIIGIERAEIYDESVLYFRSQFPLSFLEDAIKLSFI